jgi:pimeloyl-ACP methyl ester carboxylesterase
MVFFTGFQPFAFQTQRLLAECPWGGGEVTEVSRAAARITEGDFDSWQRGWEWLAGHVREQAERDEAAGNAVTARERYFRAANYYRSSEFFLRPDNPLKLQTWKQMVRCFRRAGDLSDPPFEWIDSPYDGGSTLPGYIARPPSGRGRGTVIYLNGADGTKEESWYLAGKGFTDRDVNFVTIDGPGQGEPLRLHQLYARVDYEAAVSPLVDLVVERGLDPDRIALIGVSLGGYYAGRVAAFEPRFRCIGLHGACFNVHDDCYDHYPHIQPQLQWVTGTFDDAKAPAMLREFDLGAHLPRVQVPVYICHGTQDELVDPEAANKTLAALTNVQDKTLRWWDAEQTGSLHCQVDNPTQAYPELYDWVVDHLQDAPSRPGAST